MLKIIIIGSPGSGKSTFARKLSSAAGIPLYYLDMLWHKPDGTNISRETFDANLNEIIQKDTWIIDGNYQRTLETRLKECDTVFLLDFPVQNPGSEKSGRICLGLNQNLMRNSGSGLLIFPKSSFRKYMTC